jgi:hypothetical protein
VTGIELAGGGDNRKVAEGVREGNPDVSTSEENNGGDGGRGIELGRLGTL